MSISEQIQALQTDKEDIATAIEDMGGTVNTGDGFDDFADDIRTIPTGGEIELADGLEVVNKEFAVIFFDLYQNEVERWTLEEALTKTELPENSDISDTDPNLINDGWNWTLQNIKDYINNQDISSDILVGSQYKVSDNATHLFISIPYGGRLTIPLYLKCSTAGGMTIDWGDGNTTVSSSTSLMTYSHTYDKSGDYEIRLIRTAGTITLGGNSSTYNIFGTTTDNATTHAMGNSGTLKKVYLGYLYSTGTSTYTFQKCYGLKTFVVGTNSAINTLNQYFFYYCYALRNTSFPSTITEFSGYNFQNDSCLKYVCLPHSITKIPNVLFYGCTGLRELSVPATVTSFGSQAVMNCYALKYMTIPKSITSYGTAPTGNAYLMESRKFMKDKSKIFKYTIGSDAKTNITKWCADVIDASSVTILDYNICSNCQWMEEIIINPKLTNIRTAVFQFCNAIGKVEFPSTLQEIGQYAFQYCYTLDEVKIPNSVTTMSGYNFYYCVGLCKANIPENSSFKTIPVQLFDRCYGLDEVTIPSTITTFNTACFLHLYAWQKCIIPDSVTTIGTQMFYQDYSLQYVKWSANCTSPISLNMFTQCYGMKTYDFSDVTAIPTLQSTAYIQVNSDTVIVVPDDLYSSWITATNWKNFASYIKKASEVTLV